MAWTPEPFAAGRLRSSELWVPILASGLIMGLALGARHVQGLFLLPVTADRGWSRETFALAMAAQNLTWGIAQPFAGMVADRVGPTKVIAAGLLLYAAGLIGMMEAPTVPLFVLSAGICIGIAQAGTTFGVVYAALNRLIPIERRSWALGLAGAIGGLGQFALVPATQALISNWGWMNALLSLAAVVPFLLPLVFLLRNHKLDTQPSSQHIPMAAAIAEAFRHQGFWFLNIGFLACGFQLTFAATYLPSYLIDNGMSASDGVAALSLIALANVVGTYLFGVWGGMMRRKYLLVALYLIRSAAIALFITVPLSKMSVYGFSVTMGFLFLSTVPLTNGLVAQIFGVRYIGTLFGILFFSHQVGSFFGVWAGGYLFEVTGSYLAGWTIAIVLGVVATLVHWPINDCPIVRNMVKASSA